MIRLQKELSPQILQLEITKACPFHCPQCYKESTETVHMPLNKVSSFITEAHKLGVKLIVLNGGEPLIYPRLDSILTQLHNNKIEHNLFTSGYGLTEKFLVNYMNSPYLKTFISLNGSTKEINDRSREGWEQSVNAIRLLNKYNKTFYISWVARSDNVFDFPSLVKFAEQNNISGISVIASKKDANGFVPAALSRDQLYFLANYIKAFKSDKISIIIEECYGELIRAVYGREAVCFAQKLGCAITTDGEFMSCIHQNIKRTYNSIFEYICSKKETVKIVSCMD